MTATTVRSRGRRPRIGARHVRETRTLLVDFALGFLLGALVLLTVLLTVLLAAAPLSWPPTS